MKTLIREKNYNGLVAYGTADNRTVLLQGDRDRANHLPINEETLFGIASGTKLFTALGIGLLIKEKELTLEDLAASYVTLPFEGYSQEMTIGQLLAHRSGIPDYYDEDQIEDFDQFELSVPWHKLVNPKDYLQVFPNEEQKFPPGSAFSYSNGGYVYLAMIIEAVSGMAYGDFIKERLLHPLGIERSGIYPFNQLPENTAFGYVESKGETITNIYKLPIQGAGDGGLYTCLKDMEILWKAFVSGELLGQELTKAYLTPYSCINEEKGVHYGYGVYLKDEGDYQAPYIMGLDAGVSFYSWYHHESSCLLFAVSNTSDDLWSIFGELVKKKC